MHTSTAIDVLDVDVGTYCNAPGLGAMDSYIYSGDGTSLTLTFSSDGESTGDGFILEVTSVGKGTCTV